MASVKIVEHAGQNQLKILVMVNTRKKFEGYSRGRIVIAVVLGAIAKPILDNGASRPLKYSDQVIS